MKLYRNKDWPEAGKIPFVYRNLFQRDIPCAELVAYNRDDEMYPNGYLIEHEIQGMAADKMQSGREQEIRFYAKLAELVSSVHNIRIHCFGYIGNGIADYNSITDFFEDEFDDLSRKLKGTVCSTGSSRMPPPGSILLPAYHCNSPGYHGRNCAADN